METWGRLCVLVTPRSASSMATDLAIIAGPRSAWIVSLSRAMPCRAQVSAISRWAKVADSRRAAIQPTTYREKTPRIT